MISTLYVPALCINCCVYVCVFMRRREREHLDWCVKVKIYVSICIYMHLRQNEKKHNKFTAAKTQCINIQPSVHDYVFYGENIVYAIDALYCPCIITHVSPAQSTCMMNSTSGTQSLCKAMDLISYYTIQLFVLCRFEKKEKTACDV